MIDIISIKNRLSELAIHGQLVGHTGTLADVEKIVISIKKDRDSLVKEGLSKKSKESPMIEEDTFDLPDNWKWVALGDLCVFLSRGKSPKYSEFKKYPVFAQKCNQPDGLALWKAQFLDETTLEKWPEYYRLRDRDVVINSTGTGTMGRVGYYMQESLDSAYPFMLPDSHVTVARLGDGIISRYVYYAMRSPTLQMIMEKQFRGSTNQKEYYIDSVYATPIPLPPTDEQEKIVDKLEKIFELLNSIDDFQKQYTSNQEALKSKLIDAGFTGRLTEPLPGDGSVSELHTSILRDKERILNERNGRADKNIKEIDDNVPFDIPEHWKWIRFGDVGLFKKGPFGSALTKSMFVPKNKDTVKVYEQQHAIRKDANIGTYYITKKYFDEKMSGFEVQSGDIIVSCAGTIGETYILPEDIERGIINQALMRITLAEGIDRRFFLYYFDSNLVSTHIA